ncbi:hypothetical protein ANRL4_03781 [Anaerolineae bacterium]|nr:hypothetical protein ANRL4_03781 [Anaerolineae bacterium]
MPSPTSIRLTFPEAGSPDAATLLIQRGELASLRQFAYTSETNLHAVITEALSAFAALEADPPHIPDAPPEKPAPKATAQAAPPTEPMFEIPLKKGNKSVKCSHLEIEGGEDETIQQQALALVGKIIEGKLWDGTVPIRIPDVPELAKKLKHLTARDLSMFSLEELVEIAPVEGELSPTESALDPVVPVSPSETKGPSHV